MRLESELPLQQIGPLINVYPFTKNGRDRVLP
jgi:hypothetical protein